MRLNIFSRKCIVGMISCAMLLGTFQLHFSNSALAEEAELFETEVEEEMILQEVNEDSFSGESISSNDDVAPVVSIESIDESAPMLLEDDYEDSDDESERRSWEYLMQEGLHFVDHYPDVRYLQETTFKSKVYSDQHEFTYAWYRDSYDLYDSKGTFFATVPGKLVKNGDDDFYTCVIDNNADYYCVITAEDGTSVTEYFYTRLDTGIPIEVHEDLYSQMLSEVTLEVKTDNPYNLSLHYLWYYVDDHNNRVLFEEEQYNQATFTVHADEKQNYYCEVYDGVRHHYYEFTVYPQGEPAIPVIIQEGPCGKNAFWTLDSQGNFVISGTGMVEDSFYFEEYKNKIRTVTIKSGITELGSQIFLYTPFLHTVTFEEGFKSIGYRAFANCEKLTNLNFPDSLTTFDSAVFCYCTSLKSVVIPPNVTRLPRSLFACCSSLEEVVIPEGVTFIEDAVFFGCANLAHLELPDSVEIIGDGIIVDTLIKEIYVPQNVNRINNNLSFENAPLLETIIVSEDNEIYSSFEGVLYSKDQKQLLFYPLGKKQIVWADGVEVIGIDAFSHHASAELTIPQSVKEIRSHAFNEMRNLKKITLPDKMDCIYSFPFVNTAITSIVLPEQVNYTEYTLAHCPELREVKFRQLPESIPKGFMMACNSIRSVTIPDGCSLIKKMAFEDCQSLHHVYLPKSVTEIERFAFSDCISLKDVYYAGSEEDRGKITFGIYNEYLLNATWHYNAEPVDICRDGVHYWSTMERIDLEPTCITEGKKSIRCFNCAAIKPGSEEAIPCKGHSWDKTEIIQEPTDNSEGFARVLCSSCGEVQDELLILPVLPSSPPNPPENSNTDDKVQEGQTSQEQEPQDQLPETEPQEPQDQLPETEPQEPQDQLPETEPQEPQDQLPETEPQEPQDQLPESKPQEQTPSVNQLPNQTAPQQLAKPESTEQTPPSVTQPITPSVSVKPTLDNSSVVESKSIILYKGLNKSYNLPAGNWTLSKTKAAKLKGRKLTIKKSGTIKLTEKNSGRNLTFVIANPTLSVNKAKVKLKVGETFKLIAAATPAATVKFTSSKKKIASVAADGTIKGLKKGKAVITVKANGITKKVKVSVEK